MSTHQKTLEEMWGYNIPIVEDYDNEEMISILNTKAINLSIMSINIGDSIENRLDAILGLLDNYSPVILFLIEVHSYNEGIWLLTNSFKAIGYSVYSNCNPKPVGDIFNFSRFKKKPLKGGVVAIIKNSGPILSTSNLEERS